MSNPSCHPKRSGKAVWSLVYLWLQNVCLLKNREGIHAEKSDVGLKKRQKALNSARFTYLFHYMPGLYSRNVLHSSLLYKKDPYNLHLHQFLFWNGPSAEEKSWDTAGTMYSKVETHLQEWVISCYGRWTLLQLLPAHLAEKAALSITNFLFS